ncbi:Cuticle protein 6, partial [Melipona quadrifasciata]
IPLILALSLVSGTPLNLIPYAYLSSPIPVFNQFQDTRTGVHAYSYAGGPSAKEEVKDADGVLRGSYSYVDANGILQSAFYVADENGFRVAATNIPTDENSNNELAHIILARSADKAPSRRRRSLEDTTLNSSQNEKSENLPKADVQGSSQTLLQPLLLSSGVPLATSHQSQVQVHNNARLDVTEGEAKAKPVDLQPILPVQTILGDLPVLARAPTYHENRIELHKQLGIEGSELKNAVKIDPTPLTVVRSSPAVIPLASTIISGESLPVVPVLAKESVPVIPAAQIGTASVTTSISSHGVSQIHGLSTKQATEAEVVSAVASDIAKEEIAKEASSAPATVTTSISSHGISQIHGDSKVNVEPAWLVKSAPVVQLHPVVGVPIYLH